MLIRPGLCLWEGVHLHDAAEVEFVECSDHFARRDAAIEGCRVRSGARRRCFRRVLDHEADHTAVLRNDRTAAVARPRDCRVEENLLPAGDSRRGRVDHLACTVIAISAVIGTRG